MARVWIATRKVYERPPMSDAGSTRAVGSGEPEFSTAVVQVAPLSRENCTA